MSYVFEGHSQTGQSIQPTTQAFTQVQETKIHDSRHWQQQFPTVSSLRMTAKPFKNPAHRSLRRSLRRPQLHFYSLPPLLPGTTHILRSPYNCCSKRRECYPCFGGLDVLSVRITASMFPLGLFSASGIWKNGKLIHINSSRIGVIFFMMQHSASSHCIMIKEMESSQNTKLEWSTSRRVACMLK